MFLYNILNRLFNRDWNSGLDWIENFLLDWNAHLMNDWHWYWMTDLHIHLRINKENKIRKGIKLFRQLTGYGAGTGTKTGWGIATGNFFETA